MASFHAIAPFPGTHLHDHVKEYGTLSEDLRDFTYQGAAFVPHTMTREQIWELRQRAYRTFYSRPRTSSGSSRAEASARPGGRREEREVALLAVARKGVFDMSADRRRAGGG